MMAFPQIRPGPWLVALALVVAPMVAYGAFVSPMQERLGEIDSEIAEKKEIITRLPRLRQQARDVTAAVDAARREYSAAWMLPAQGGAANEARLQSQITKVIGDCGARLGRMRVVAPKDGAATIGVEALIQTDMSGLPRLLAGLDEVRPVLFITSVTITARGQTDGRDVVDVQLEVESAVERRN